MSVKRNSFISNTTDFTEFKENQFMRQPEFGGRGQPQMNNTLPPFNQSQMPINQMRQMPPMHSSEKKQNQTYGMLPAVYSMDQDFLPQEILFLLSEEEHHIKRFRNKVEKEKERVKNDIIFIKEEINNMMDDLGVQIQQFIDEHYKRYVHVYAIFKDEVIQFKQAKLEAPLNLVPPPTQINTECSNANLIRELEEMRYKNYVSKIQTYVSELAKQRIEQIQVVSKDLLQLTSNDSNFYNSENTQKQLNLIKYNIEETLVSKFGDMTEYVQPLDMWQSKAKSFNETIKSSDTYTTPQYGAPTFNQTQTQLQPPPVGLISTLNQLGQVQQLSTTSLLKQQTQQTQQTQRRIINSHYIHGQIDNITPKGQINTPHSQMLLCFTYIKDDLIATASKDSTIKIWDGQQNIATLKGHKGGVCTLATIKYQGQTVYLASGSDHGDNSVKIWNVNNFQEHITLNGHTAAVVALLSLEDGLIVSGSYDKSIIVWDIDNPEPLQRLNQHTNAVTSLVLAGNRFVSGGLDSLICVWKKGFKLERVIKNTTLVCTLNIINLTVPRIVSGGKDGKIREFDLFTGDLINNYQVSVGPILETAIIQDGQEYSIISLTNKEKNLIVSQNGQNKVLDVNVEIEFGCGVYPKFELIDRNGLELLIVSQKQPMIYQYQI